MKAAFAIAFKDLRILRRDRFAVFWTLGFPLVYAIFFGFIASGGGGPRGKIKLAIVDQDGGKATKEFVARLSQSESLAVSAATESEAREAVRKGDATAYLKIPAGFGGTIGSFSPERVDLELGVDPARQAERGMLQGLLIQSVFEGAADQFLDLDKAKEQFGKFRKQIEGAKDWSPLQKLTMTTVVGSAEKFFETLKPEDMPKRGKAAGGDKKDSGDGGFAMVPMKVVDVAPQEDGKTVNAFEIFFPSSLMWGAMGCAAGFAISLVQERIGGTLLRLKVAPIRGADVLAGKAIACFLAIAAMMTLLLLVGGLVFKVRIFANPLALLLGIVSTAICFVGIMMFMSTWGKTPSAVGGSGWSVMMLMAMIGGGMIPLVAMPEFLQKISVISPVRWGILSLEGAIWRGFSIGEMLQTCGVLVAVGAAGFAAGVLVLRRREA